MISNSLALPQKGVLRVLVLEDPNHPADVCLDLLQEAGYQVTCETAASMDELRVKATGDDYQFALAEPGVDAKTAEDWRAAWPAEEAGFPLVLVTRGLDAANPPHRENTAAIWDTTRDQLLATVDRALQWADWQEGLKRARSGFESLASKVNDGVLISRDATIVFANKAAVKMSGAESPADLLGRPTLSLVHPADRGALDVELERARIEEPSVLFAAHWQPADGRPLEVQVSVGGTFWREQPAALLVIRDVSESKRVEATISSLAAFAQFNPNPVFEFSEEGKIIFYNEAATELARSLGGESPHDLIPGDTLVFVRTCLESGQRKSGVETTIDGRTFSWSFFPVPQSRVVHCYVAEVTERQKLEAQLRHSQKLESVGRLAAGVAHDFNNILTIIQGHLGLLKSSAGLNSMMQESLQQVARATERAGHLTNQLLTFSRRSTMRRRRQDLNEVLTNISMMLHRTLGEDIDYQFSYAPRLPGVFADGAMLEQLIMILAVNARDAMPRGGQLIIGTSVAEIDASYVEKNPEAREGRFVCLSMVDSGCGMDHVTMSRLFEPFFTTKEFGKGNGLGLAVVHRIVRQHQGWVEVQSLMGHGSTFRVYLPPCTPEQEVGEEAGAEESPATPGGREKVLLVEDEPPVRWIVKNVLERQGYEVLEAGSGVEALAIWHQHHETIDLLLTDMVMPVGLNGQELAEKFQSVNPDLKVIYTSGYSEESVGGEPGNLALIEGVNFLQKPFDANKLASAVRRSLDG